MSESSTESANNLGTLNQTGSIAQYRAQTVTRRSNQFGSGGGRDESLTAENAGFSVPTTPTQGPGLTPTTGKTRDDAFGDGGPNRAKVKKLINRNVSRAGSAALAPPSQLKTRLGQ